MSPEIFTNLHQLGNPDSQHPDDSIIVDSHKNTYALGLALEASEMDKNGDLNPDGSLVKYTDIIDILIARIKRKMCLDISRKEMICHVAQHKISTEDDENKIFAEIERKWVGSLY